MQNHVLTAVALAFLAAAATVGIALWLAPAQVTGASGAAILGVTLAAAVALRLWRGRR